MKVLVVSLWNDLALWKKKKHYTNAVYTILIIIIIIIIIIIHYMWEGTDYQSSTASNTTSSFTLHQKHFSATIPPKAPPRPL